MHPDFTIRPARLNEVLYLNHLIKASSTKLGEGFYTPQQIASLNTHVFGVDKELIEDQTYYVIEKNGVMAGCGGWSKRRTLFGGDQFTDRPSGYLDPATDPAKIRAFFIHPDFARRGLGTALLTFCEDKAKEAGFTQVELMSTMPGVPFYQHEGYTAIKPCNLPLPDKVEIPLVQMGKTLQCKPKHHPCKN